MLKILVIQFSTDASKEHAQKCFRETCPNAGFDFFDAINGNFTAIDLDQYCGVILGGSGQYYLSQGDGADSWLLKVFKLLDILLEKNIPTLGICFGSQIIALHQGGTIVREPAMQETGTFETYLFDSAINDPIFLGVPRMFAVQLAHKDTFVGLPSMLIQLSKSDRVACNVFRVSGKPVWAVLFHPELNLESVKVRAAMFPSYIHTTEGVPDALNLLFRESPEAGLVLQNFVNFAQKSLMVELPALSAKTHASS